MRHLFRDERDWTALAGYFAGELPPEEAARLEASFRSDPARAEELERLRRIWCAGPAPSAGWDAGAALEKVKRTAAAGALPPAVSGARRHRAPRLELPTGYWWTPTLVAALLVIAVVAGWRALAPRASEAPATEMAEFSTARGQRAALSLPDGSRVILGVASRLLYPVHSFQRQRDLYLEGEAYFEVVHDPARPLRIHTRRGMTEDLGTAFGVTDRWEGEFRVVVAEGTVLLRRAAGGADGSGGPAGDSLVLQPAEMAELGRDGRLTLRANVDVGSYLAWREGRLVFRDAPLRDVLARLGNWYDLEFELGDSALARRPFTAAFNEHDSAEQVLRVLAVATGLRYERRGALYLVLADPRTPVARP